MIHLLLAIVVSLYIVSVLIGFFLAKKDIINMDWFVKTHRTLTDPVTIKLRNWLDRHKTTSMRDKKWFRFGALIFLNNLLIVAFISRTVYGLLMVLPIYFTIRQGLSHGILLAKPMSSKPGPKTILISIFEFTAYFLATAVGINLGLSFIRNSENLATSIAMALNDFIYVYPIIVLLLILGAYLETSLLRAKMSNFEIPHDFDMEKAREQALKMLQKKQGKTDLTNEVM